MTSMPASRNARAITFAPRSWPSRPGLATSTRILRSEGICQGILSKALPVPWVRCSMRWGMPPDDYARAFARNTDAAYQRERTNPASVLPHPEPCHLVLTCDHPRRRIGGMVGLFQIIGRVHVNICSVRIPLLAIAFRTGAHAGHGPAVVFVVLQQDLSVRASDKVARRNGRDSGFRRPLTQVLGKRRRKLAHLERFFLHLFRKNIHRGRGFAIRWMEIESPEGDAILQINPYKSPAREVWSTAAGNHYVPPIADLDRQRRAVQYLFQRVGERHVPAIMKHAIRDHAVH